MLKKSFNLIKKNPVILLLYFVYMVIAFSILFLLYPKDFSQIAYTEAGVFSMSTYMLMMGKIMLAALLVSLLGLLFLSGYGNMIRNAILNEKTSVAVFIPGVKKYFVRLLLSMLLLMAFAIGASVILSILTIPITVMLTLNGSASVGMISVVIVLLSFVIILIPMPFVILWIPAIFMDDTKVMKSLKYGAKAGAKNYWRLILAMILLYVPLGVNTVTNLDSYTSGHIFTTSYLLVYLATAVLAAIFFTYIFVVYHEYRMATYQDSQPTMVNHY